MSARYTLQEKVDNFFASLRPRYRPYQMHQFCMWCGREYPRTAYVTIRYQTCDKRPVPHTHHVCKYCRMASRAGKAPSRGKLIPWESREMMMQRLIAERGTVTVTRNGMTRTRVFTQTAAHRKAIGDAVRGTKRDAPRSVKQRKIMKHRDGSVWLITHWGPVMPHTIVSGRKILGVKDGLTLGDEARWLGADLLEITVEDLAELSKR